MKRQSPTRISLKSYLNVYTAIIFLSAILFIFKFPSTSENTSSISLSSTTTTTTTKMTTSMSSESNDNSIGGYSFEIHGKVQGVYFRKYTQRRAREIGDVVGWIRNTSRGTVEGEIASRSLNRRQTLKVWLQTTGSPKSEITKYEFQDLPSSRVQELLDELDDFIVQKTKRR